MTESGTVARHGWKAVAACVLLAAVAGCTGPAGQQASRGQIPPADEGTPTEVPPLPDGDFSPIIYNGVAPVPVEPVRADPQQLLGMTTETLDKFLGEPAVVRRDGGVEVWQYRADDCVLDLFLYGNVKTVEHVDLRDRGDSTDVMVRACFGRMLKEDLPTS